MTKIEDRLEALFAKVRALPEERQEQAAVALEEITEDEPYILSEEEQVVLEPRLEEAKRGENLIDADKVDILNKPWA